MSSKTKELASPAIVEINSDDDNDDNDDEFLIANALTRRSQPTAAQPYQVPYHGGGMSAANPYPCAVTVNNASQIASFSGGFHNHYVQNGGSNQQAENMQQTYYKQEIASLKQQLEKVSRENKTNYEQYCNYYYKHEAEVRDKTYHKELAEKYAKELEDLRLLVKNQRESFGTEIQGNIGCATYSYKRR